MLTPVVASARNLTRLQLVSNMADYRPTRRQREQKAFTLAAVSGTTGVATVVTALLALITSFSWGIVFLLAAICVATGLMFKRSVGG